MYSYRYFPWGENTVMLKEKSGHHQAISVLSLQTINVCTNFKAILLIVLRYFSLDQSNGPTKLLKYWLVEFWEVKLESWKMCNDILQWISWTDSYRNTSTQSGIDRCLKLDSVWLRLSQHSCPEQAALLALTTGKCYCPRGVIFTEINKMMPSWIKYSLSARARGPNLKTCSDVFCAASSIAVVTRLKPILAEERAILHVEVLTQTQWRAYVLTTFLAISDI